jgi:hypothetical protein
MTSFACHPEPVEGSNAAYAQVFFKCFSLLSLTAMVIMPTTTGACQQSGSATDLLAPVSYQGSFKLPFHFKVSLQTETSEGFAFAARH